MDKNYSKRELDHYFGDIKGTLEKQNVILEEIKVQTTEHNHRMSKVEWRQTATMWAIPIIITIVIFLLNYFK